MTVHRFRIIDEMNEWAYAIEVEADNDTQARARAESYMFARRSVGDADGLVHIKRDD